MQNQSDNLVKKYRPLAIAAGIGSILGSGIIVGLSATITVWQQGLALSNTQVGVISGALTFAIAIGSLVAGWLTKNWGLTRSFNWLNLGYAVGALICVLANSYGFLLTGVIITGLASGADLPVSLTIISHDVPDDKATARLVSFTQVFWQIGVFFSYGCAFVVSKMTGATGARIVFTILAVCAAITFIWRTFSGRFKEFHREANQRIDQMQSQRTSESGSLFKILRQNHQYGLFFIWIMIFYCCWNLLANTFGQFQTFTLVQAHASQSFATGAGLVLNVVALIASISFASVAGSRYRNKFFVVGSVIELLAMLGLALSSHALWPIVIAIGFYNLGNNIAGEAMYKVWTQESFPIDSRASVQGFISGFSRFLCGIFAFITPTLVLPSHIRMTMFGFAGIVAVCLIAGLVMIRLQKRYQINVEE
ncbi:MFS transporter [Pediococcus acidilactici]|uniref:MFS transporter n=1 Tax=Pediococcus acidilactici TaxID=1254 RepID=UPI001BD6512C|nr:MFS transporter [Pediococcus acidilactici]MBS9398780.1 MFS transporter [Pediococcus acidilactici]